jgi:hypothetical protein
MHAGHEDGGLRRRNMIKATHELAGVFRMWRRDDPTRRERLSPYSTESTPPLGEMTDEEIEHWARQVSARDAERSINMSNEAIARAKAKAGEAA